MNRIRGRVDDVPGFGGLHLAIDGHAHSSLEDVAELLVRVAVRLCSCSGGNCDLAENQALALDEGPERRGVVASGMARLHGPGVVDV